MSKSISTTGESGVCTPVYTAGSDMVSREIKKDEAKTKYKCEVCTAVYLLGTQLSVDNARKVRTVLRAVAQYQQLEVALRAARTAAVEVLVATAQAALLTAQASLKDASIRTKLAVYLPSGDSAWAQVR